MIPWFQSIIIHCGAPMSLYKLPASAIIHSFSESYAVMVNHFPSCICLMWQRRKALCRCCYPRSNNISAVVLIEQIDERRFWRTQGANKCTKSAKSRYKEEVVFIFWRRHFWLALYSGFSYLGLNWGPSAGFHRGFSLVFFSLGLSLPFQRGHS